MQSGAAHSPAAPSQGAPASRTDAETRCAWCTRSAAESSSSSATSNNQSSLGIIRCGREAKKRCEAGAHPVAARQHGVPPNSLWELASRLLLDNRRGAPPPLRASSAAAAASSSSPPSTADRPSAWEMDRDWLLSTSGTSGIRTGGFTRMWCSWCLDTPRFSRRYKSVVCPGSKDGAGRVRNTTATILLFCFVCLYLHSLVL